MSQRLFTLSEANALIPKLEIIIEKLQRHSRILQEHVQEMARASGGVPESVTSAQLLEQQPGLRAVVEQVEELLAEIRQCGAQFKGLELGLVDFPAQVDGEIVLLCWQYGEKEIGFYHPMDGGFAGRKALRRARPRYLQ